MSKPAEAAGRILRHAEALGGVSRVMFQMDNAELAPEKLLRSIELLGEVVQPALQ